MFFLLRCTFWLGLVFSMIDWSGAGAPRAADVVSAAQSAGRSATQAAMSRIAAACTADPAACLEGVKKIDQLRANVATGPKTPALKRSGADTLRGADLQPTWRGRG